MIANDTIHEQAQTALQDLNCVRLEPAITGLEACSNTSAPTAQMPR